MVSFSLYRRGPFVFYFQDRGDSIIFVFLWGGIYLYTRCLVRDEGLVKCGLKGLAGYLPLRYGRRIGSTKSGVRKVCFQVVMGTLYGLVGSRTTLQYRARFGRYDCFFRANFIPIGRHVVSTGGSLLLRDFRLVRSYYLVCARGCNRLLYVSTTIFFCGDWGLLSRVLLFSWLRFAVFRGSSIYIISGGLHSSPLVDAQSLLSVILPVVATSPPT